MKKFFLKSVVFCIISFICFQLSVSIFEKKQRNTSTVYHEVNSNYNQGKASIFSGDYTDSNVWTVLNKFPGIHINSAGIDTIVTRGESTDIKVRLDNPAGRKIHVEAVYSGQDLYIEARSTNITFLSNAPFGLVSWLEDIFTDGASKATVIIEFPETKYSNLIIQQGSGSMKVHDLYAASNNIHIGSGDFEFLRRSESFVSSTFDFELGSGKAVISGMQTEDYRIDIGSGSFNINDLSGTGTINMGSGSGSIAYKEYNGSCKIDMGSGSLKLYLPEDSSMRVSADIGSGSVSVDACGVSAKLTSHSDDDPVIIGDGEYDLFVDMGSGHVSVFDRSAYSEPVIKGIIISSYENEVITSSSSSQYEQSTILPPAEVESVPEDNSNFSEASSDQSVTVTEQESSPEAA